MFLIRLLAELSSSGLVALLFFKRQLLPWSHERPRDRAWITPEARPRLFQGSGVLVDEKGLSAGRALWL
eukprot:7182363-Alexandrium_andersonii.AAC.1